MLVLTRRVGDIICFGDPKSEDAPIEIQVAQIRRDGAIRIGIVAPPETVVDRLEIWEEKKAEQK